MGSDSVYRILQEVFPQVDSRILRAFALEHPKDADVAVEAVLTEVIPQITEQSLIVRSSNRNKSSPSSSSEVVVDNGKNVQLEATIDPFDFISEKSTEAGPSNFNGTSIGTIKGSSDQINSPTVLGPTIVEQQINILLADNNDIINLDNSPISENIASFTGTVVNSNEDFGSFHEDGSKNDDFADEIVKPDDESTINTMLTKSEQKCSTQLLEEICLNQMMNKNDSYIHLDLNNESLIDSGSKNDDFADEIVKPDDESTMNTMLTKSEQKCSIQLLEEIFEEAKNNKNILVTAMNSVVELIKEVECKEKIAEELKEEACQGCSYYYAKVDELKHALLRAKEANDMRAGEVYAEKAILATELKELQLRLLSLADERNKSLALLDEMREAVEIRLVQALEDIKAANEQKVEKEKAAKEELLLQENQMEKVVEESKKLKLEAEENSELQEFLMDRGRSIDILLGEFFVKRQDISLLKEKLDKKIPLSRSLSSSQTSSILASSNSSFKSTGLRLEPEPESYQSPKKGLEPEPNSYESPKKVPELDDSYGFLEKSLSKSESGQSPKSLTETRNPIDNNGDYDDEFPSFEEEKQIDDNGNNNKVVVEDGWELFDKDDFIMSR